MNLDVRSVEKQTRFLPFLAKIMRMFAILAFSLGVVFGVILLFGDHPITVDEYGNRKEDTLVRGLSLLIGGIFQAALCLIVASLLDSFRAMAMNSARAASVVSASA